MLKSCVQTVEKGWKNYGQVLTLNTSSTARHFFVVERTDYLPALATAFEQPFKVFTQALLSFFSGMGLGFYTFSTKSINTNKLIKE